MHQCGATEGKLWATARCAAGSRSPALGKTRQGMWNASAAPCCAFEMNAEPRVQAEKMLRGRETRAARDVRRASCESSPERGPREEQELR